MIQQEWKITPQLVYDATNGGLDIIHEYYPQSVGCEGTKKYFKIRDEGSASCRLSEYNGIYYVTDFGDSGKSRGGFLVMNALEVMMREDSRKPEFYECLNILAEKHGLSQESTKQKAEYKYEKLPPVDGAPVGNIAFETKEWDMAELQTVFARRVWERLQGMNLRLEKDKREAKGDDVAYRNAVDLCKEYGLLSLKHYDLTARDSKSGNLVTHRFGSTGSFPILMWEAGTWQKIYKPNARDKKFRFVIRGEKNHIMFGYAMAKKKFEELLDESDASASSGQEEDAAKKPAKKLNEVIICSGGSDALNVAAMGYAVVWFDSEMFSLTSDEYTKLTSIAEKVYYLPDIDGTGVKKAVEIGMEWLNIHLIFLPNDLKREYDMRGNQCKDVRDFFRTHGQRDFDTCLKQSMPLRFWDENVKLNKEGKVVKKNGRAQIEYKPNNELMYNFLYRNDFGLYEMPSIKAGQILVRKKGNVVQKIAFRNINQYIKEFLNVDSVMRLVGYNYVEIRNAFHRSAQFSENSMDNLKYLSLEFKDTGKHHQLMFFENETWKIDRSGIKAIQHDKVPAVAWEDEVIPDRVKVLEPLFEIFKPTTPAPPSQGGENEFFDIDIKILRKDCHFLNFLINTSRIYWRTELEDRLDKLTDEEQLKYKKEHQFSIDGPLLTPKEIHEQKLILISKLQTFGYLLHRYKDKAEAYCVWVMDYNMMTGASDENESHGGTGKSISYEILSRYMRTKFLNGRDKKQLENPHIMEGTTEHTDYLFVDDAMKGIDFDFFYGLITGFMPVNPKGTSEYIIPFTDSPKLTITSNFAPARNDKSTRRRMWFSSFSDYYHKNPNGEYREERLPKDEFGLTLFDDFDAEQWNYANNLFARCVQSWLIHGKVESAEENVLKNILVQRMGPGMMAWADEFFHPDNGRLDSFVQRHVVFEDAKKRISPNLTPQGFMDRMRAWCQYKGYVMNPKNLIGKDGRIMKHVAVDEYRNGEIKTTELKATKECIFIKAGSEPVVFSPAEAAAGQQLKIGDGAKDMPF